MGRDEMRAGDGDRQSAADRLRQAVDEGRLDLHEYDERLQRAYAAKTYGDLDSLLADLPTAVPTERSQVAVPMRTAPAATDPPRYPDATRRWLVENWNSYLGAVAICVGIWLVSVLGGDDPVPFWPVWVIVPWGALLVWSTVSGLMSREPQRWAAKQERKKAARRARKGRAEGGGAMSLDERA